MVDSGFRRPSRIRRITHFPAMPSTPDTLEVLKQFRIIFKSVKAHFQNVEAQCRLSGAQLWALSVIVGQTGIKVSELAKELSIHQSTASNLVERLVSQGLVEKERSREDQRVVRLTPTAAGIGLVRQAPGPAEGVLPDALGHLPKATLDQLQHNLSELIAGYQFHYFLHPVGIQFVENIIQQQDRNSLAGFEQVVKLREAHRDEIGFVLSL